MEFPEINIVDETRAGPVLRVRVRARARTEGVGGADAAGVRVTVRAAPEKGKANAVVLRVLAEWLGIPPRDLELVSGDTSADKRVLVHGITAAEIRARVRSVLRCYP